MSVNDLSSLKERLRNVKGSKQNPIYQSNIYWSKKAFNVTDVLIEELSDKGDVVFDPFMGSGVSVIESVSDQMNRNAVGVDINEVPLFIVNHVLKHNNMTMVCKKLKAFTREVVEKLEGLYKTEVNGKAGICVTTRFDIIDKKKIPVEIKGRLSDSGKKFVKKEFSIEDISKLNENYDLSNVTDIELMEDSKLAARKGEHISEIFTGRNLHILDEIIGLSKKEQYKEIKEDIDYLLLSMIHLCKITDTHSNSQWPLWIPNNNCIEKNVVDILVRHVESTIRQIKFTNQKYHKCTKRESVKSFIGNCNYALFDKGIQNITDGDIPDGSVDLIITDPPYMGQVAYSEYMQLYLPFFDFNINYDDEIVVSSAPSRNKNELNYFELLDNAFEICSKKLKIGKVLCLYFHDSKLAVWVKLMKMLESHGFHFITQLHVNKTPTVKNNISKKKSLNGDALLFFTKENIKKKKNKKIEDIDTIKQNIIVEAKHMISNSPNGLSTPELYDDGLMEYIIHNGWLDSLSKNVKSLVEIFEGFLIWDEKSGRWYAGKV